MPLASVMTACLFDVLQLVDVVMKMAMFENTM